MAVRRSPCLSDAQRTLSATPWNGRETVKTQLDAISGVLAGPEDDGDDNSDDDGDGQD